MKNSVYLRHFIIILTFFISVFSTYAQTVEVTFQVDMSNETVSSNGVHIAGNFQSVAVLGADWNPGSTQLSDADEDDIYYMNTNLSMVTHGEWMKVLRVSVRSDLRIIEQ